MPAVNGNNEPTPPSSTSSNGASPDTQNFRVVRKRNRIPLSCAPCRHRKLKCNRGHPCDNCTKRGDTNACSYAVPGARKKAGANGANQSPDDMQNRIDRLEGLVLSLMTSGGGNATNAAQAQAAINSSRSNSLSTGSDLRLDVEGADMIEEEPDTTGTTQCGNGHTQCGNGHGQGEDDSEMEQVSKGIGIMKVDNGRAVFASDAHWYAILGEISEVKQYFKDHKEDYRAQMERVQAAKADESPGTAFLLQGPAAKDRQELLASFPSKADADRLIARYFNAYDPSVHIIHGPSFQKQYDRHWLAPHETPVIWVGLCYAMMTLALQSYHRSGDEPPEYRGRAMELSHGFRRLTAQCLLLADITQPIAQILETLVLHVQAEYGRSRDAEPGVLVMISLCVRLAMRMGYHRDPGPHPQITAFQAEIRRRVWSFVRGCDIHISFQFGLPAIIRSDHCDTQAPRNVYDDELYEDMQVLPASRPVFEATPMSYMNAKYKMTSIFGRVVERWHSITNPPTYEEVMKYDHELREARGTHPPLLQMRSFQDSARDPANLIMQRLGLETVYLRSLFVLHRRFIAKGRENPRYAYSRRTCIDASMQLLEHQATLHHESQPGGRLRSVKWYISSLTTHDFLLAAMLVCLDLWHVSEAERKGQPVAPASPADGSNGGRDFYAGDRREEMLRAVEHCIGIWEGLKNDSMEAYKASVTLRVMVEKLKAHRRVMEAMSPAQREALRQRNQNGDGSAPRGPNPYVQLPKDQVNPLKRPAFGAFPNGAVASFEPNGAADEDMPPEQSAAMTLGLLSSGGMSPGPNFPLAGAAGAGSTGAEKQAGYPASITALLNEPMPGEVRTGLTPQYSGPEAQMPMGPASPFSQMLASTGTGGFMGMEGLGGDIDWGAWDQYIQGTTSATMDPSLQSWPMNIDPAVTDGQQGQQQQAPGAQQSQGPTGTNMSSPGGVFMGATTPSMMG